MPETVYTDADLRSWRARERLSQVEAAKVFGLDQRTYARWEEGRYPRNFSRQFEVFVLGRTPGYADREASKEAKRLAKLVQEEADKEARFEASRARDRSAMAKEVANGRFQSMAEAAQYRLDHPGSLRRERPDLMAMWAAMVAEQQAFQTEV